MAILYTEKKAFDEVVKYLEENQYIFEVSTNEGQYLIEIKE